MLFHTIKIECKKAVCNPYFYLTLLIGLTITFFSLVPSLQSYYRDIGDHRQFAAEFGPRNPLMQMQTLFNHWIGGESFTSGSGNYFFLFPLLAAIPYGWSYCSESKSGYVKNVVIRAGKMPYYLAKYIATFVSGGLAVVAPLLFNFLLTAMWIPAVKPDPSYLTSYGIGPASFLSMLFYAHPFLYVFTYLLVDFLFCGLIACLCLTASIVLKNRVAVVLLPFFLLLGIHYLCYSLLYTSRMTIYRQLSPMAYLRPVPTSYDTDWPIVLAWGIGLFLLTFVPIVLRGRCHEL